MIFSSIRASFKRHLVLYTSLILTCVIVFSVFYVYRNSIYGWLVERHLQRCCLLVADNVTIKAWQRNEESVLLQGISLQLAEAVVDVDTIEIRWHPTLWPPKLAVHVDIKGIDNHGIFPSLSTLMQVATLNDARGWLQVERWELDDIALHLADRAVHVKHGRVAIDTKESIVSGDFSCCEDMGNLSFQTTWQQANKQSIWQCQWFDMPSSQLQLLAGNSLPLLEDNHALVSGDLRGDYHIKHGQIILDRFEGDLALDKLTASIDNRVLNSSKMHVDAVHNGNDWILEGKVALQTNKDPLDLNYQCKVEIPADIASIVLATDMLSEYTQAEVSGVRYHGRLWSDKCHFQSFWELFNADKAPPLHCEDLVFDAEFNSTGVTASFESPLWVFGLGSHPLSVEAGSGSAIELCWDFATGKRMAMATLQEGKSEWCGYTIDHLDAQIELLPETLYIRHLVAVADHLKVTASCLINSDQDGYTYLFYPKQIEGSFCGLSSLLDPTCKPLGCLLKDSSGILNFDATSSILLSNDSDAGLTTQVQLCGCLEQGFLKNEHMQIDALSMSFAVYKDAFSLENAKGILTLADENHPLHISKLQWQHTSGLVTGLFDSTWGEGVSLSGTVRYMQDAFIATGNRVFLELDPARTHLAKWRPEQLNIELDENLHLHEVQLTHRGSLSDLYPIYAITERLLGRQTSCGLDVLNCLDGDLQAQLTYRPPENHLSLEKGASYSSHGWHLQSEEPVLWQYDGSKWKSNVVTALLTVPPIFNLTADIPVTLACAADASSVDIDLSALESVLVMVAGEPHYLEKMHLKADQRGLYLQIQLLYGGSSWLCRMHFEKDGMCHCVYSPLGYENGLEIDFQLLEDGTCYFHSIKGSLPGFSCQLVRPHNALENVEFTGVVQWQKQGEVLPFAKQNLLCSLLWNDLDINAKMTLDGHWCWDKQEIAFQGDFSGTQCILASHADCDQMMAKLLLTDAEAVFSQGVCRGGWGMCTFEELRLSKDNSQAKWHLSSLVIDAPHLLQPLRTQNAVFEYLEGRGLAVRTLQGRGSVTLAAPLPGAAWPALGVLLQPAVGSIDFTLADGLVQLQELKNVSSRGKKARYTLWEEAGASVVDLERKELDLHLRVKCTHPWLHRTQWWHLNIYGPWNKPQCLWREKGHSS
jgi:hypothetical protein